MDLPDRRLSPAEYLALEAVSPERLEYRDGYAVALAAPSTNHSLITGTLALTLGAKARANGCRFFSDAKVLTPNGDRLIPDFFVTCDKRDRDAAGDGSGEGVVRYPWLVIEVLSPSTAADDLTEKSFSYQSIPELTHFVAIDSRRRAVYVSSRTEDGLFVTRSVDRLILPTLGDHGLTLDDLYTDTTVPILRNVRSPKAGS